MIAGALLALPLVASPAAAQSPGQFAPRTELVAGNMVAVRFGHCLLKHDRRDAIALVEAAPGSDLLRAMEGKVQKPMIACLDGARSASINGFYLRGSIAEALLLENGGTLLKAASASPVIAPERVVGSDGEDASATVLDCAVGADPADAGAMLSATAATTEEMAAFSRLAPSLQACAPASGAVNLRRPTVRPAVAIALYRLGRGAAASGAINGSN